MLVNAIFQTYFNSCSILEDQNVSKEDKLIAKICIATYFFILPPILFGIAYGISVLCNWIWKIGSEDSLTVKTKEQFAQTFPPQQPQPPEQLQQIKTYPVVSQNMQRGFFVEVLNKGGYSLNGTDVILPPAETPIKFKPASDNNFKESLTALKEIYKIDDQRKMQFQFKDRTTEEAINESEGSCIALNFANEDHIGGGPGFHRDPKTGELKYDAPSSRAQEESLGQRTNILVSLMQLSHVLKADKGNPKFIRSYYTNKFDSRCMAYVSLNHLFAVQGAQDFYSSRYLSEPKAVAFITSAASYYGDKSNIDCSKGSNVYKDARQRIETHLLAAAFRAGTSKTENPDAPVELILGAFGCGVFAPKDNADAYREMIAELYKELLDDFHGFFDLVTFAVPTFGGQNPKDAAVANHNIFKKVLRRE